jgi:hypothetical protein
MGRMTGKGRLRRLAVVGETAGVGATSPLAHEPAKDGRPYLKRSSL